MKMSEDRSKMINPGFQITWRISKNYPDEVFKIDVTCLRGDDTDQAISEGKTITLFDEFDRFKYKTMVEGEYTAKPLQIQMMQDGKRCIDEKTLSEKKSYYNETLARFSPSEKRLINPHFFKVDISDQLLKTKIGIIERLVSEIENFTI